MLHRALNIILTIVLASRCFGQPDTLNKTDAYSCRQGYWILYSKDKTNIPCDPKQKLEEGRYVNGKKEGLWTEYFCNGKLKNTIVFVNGRPEGSATTYYENGYVSEEGVWHKNRWIGHYRQYNPDGSLFMYLHFNEKGKKDSALYCPLPADTTTFKYLKFEHIPGKIITGKQIKNKPVISTFDWPDKEKVIAPLSDSLYLKEK